MKFYNREKELNYLKTYCQLEPNSILFVYGPKSSGKSTVMRRVIKELEDSDIVFFYYNLREHATYNKEEFLNIFYKKEASLNDVFTKILEGITEAVRDGYKPILVIDELQKLSGIYLDENKNKTLLNELFNLFVDLTKVKHLCHVICLTSNDTLINEVFVNSTLKNASEYYLIDWLSKEDVEYILKEEGFSEEEINYCLKYLSLPYEISQVINNKKLGLSVEEAIKQWINVGVDKILYLISTQKEFEMERLVNALKLFKDKIKVGIKEIIQNNLMDEVKFLIENEVLFYDVINGVVKPTSIIEWFAIGEVLK
jgi:AAA+ ATPase superfamily predicted ATPase